MTPLTTKMSSRGQVVIPQPIRAQLRLEPGVEFVVVAKDDALVFQRIPSPSWEQFDMLIREAQRQARSAGLTLRHVRRAIARVRGEHCPNSGRAIPKPDTSAMSFARPSP
jgi:AbrB family looped-hinge helix DNA binding protein